MAVSPLTLALTAVLCIVLSWNVEFASGKVVVCYATNWPQYRPGQGKFAMSDIDPTKCTYMVFAFAKVVGNRLTNYEENDVGQNGQYMQFTRLKQRYPNTRTLLGVGGWTHGGDPFSAMASTPQSRSEFVRTTIDYLRRYNFDGLDLDWEYPKANDKQNLVLLLQELRQAFDAEAARGRSPLLLLMAVAAGLQNAVPAYDVPALNRYLDFISVMTYDYHGAWEDKTGLLAPLNSPPGDDLSMTISLNWWVNSGASKSKLLVGLALYGRAWTLANPGDTAIGSPTTGQGPIGRFTREAGVLSHYEICERLQTGRYTTVLDALGQTNYAYNVQEWITYEDTVSLADKVQFILSNDFAGAMVWSFDQDDFKGEFCRRGPYPLMSVIANGLLTAASRQPQPQPYTPPQLYNPTPIYPQPQPYNPSPIYPQPQPYNPSPIYPQPQPYNPSPIYPQPQPYPQPGVPISPHVITPEQIAQDSTLTTQCPPVPVPAQNLQPPFVAGQAFNCPAPNGKFADPASCDYYYFCLFQMPFRERCPMFSQFNPSRMDCECVASSDYLCPFRAGQPAQPAQPVQPVPPVPQPQQVPRPQPVQPVPQPQLVQPIQPAPQPVAAESAPESADPITVPQPAS
ncbi:hypothetical protein RRG08_056657 [Elysia crispata]|uniref:Chitinase n=1 Tax=Elysia crispata TaxID=231223 RepID=A0AAE0YH08_9GAST|nr:hypothetical protein RRG08_056657 [Elysia crispata]